MTTLQRNRGSDPTGRNRPRTTLTEVRESDAPATRADEHREQASTGIVIPLAFAIPMAMLPLRQAFAAESWWWGVFGASVLMIGAAWLARRFFAAWTGTIAALIVGVASVWVQTWQPLEQSAPVDQGPIETLFLGWATGAQAVWVSSPPVPVSAEVALLLVSAGALLVIVADFVAVVLRAPAVVAVIIVLAAAAPPHGQLPDGWQMLPILIVATTLLLVGPARRRFRLEPLALGAVAVAIVAVLVIPSLLPTPRVIPDLSVSLGDPDADVPTIQGGNPTLDPAIDVTQDLQRGAPVPLFEYHSSTGEGVRLQLVSYMGAVSTGFVGLTDGVVPQHLDEIAPTAVGTPQSMSVSPFGFTSFELPLPPSPTAVSGTPPDDARWYDGGDTAQLMLDFRVEDDYDVQYVQPNADPAILATAGVGSDPALTSLPDEALGLFPIADAIVPDGATPYEAALALQQYFATDDWEYSEDVPYVDGDQATTWVVVEQFLTDRVGYCVHYATAMAALARAAGLPARVTIGFMEGTPVGDGAYRVTTNDMHAWAEIWFEGIGWVPFETTPGGAAESTSALGSNPDGAVVDQPPPVDPDVPPVVPPAPPVSGEPEPSTEPSSTDPAASEPASEQPDDPDSAGVDPVRIDWTLVSVILATALGLLLNLAPAGLRVMQRRARLRRGASGAWQELVATIIDAGERPPRSHTMRDVEEHAASWLDDDAALAALGRVREAAERGRYGGDADAHDWSEDVALVRSAVAARRTPLERVVAVLAPRSVSGLDRELARRS